jgi:hypothetical protein
VCRKLTPLEEHLAWIFRHQGWQKAIHADEERRQRDFSDAPIKRWYDAHLAALRELHARERMNRSSARVLQRSKVKA